MKTTLCQSATLRAHAYAVNRFQWLFAQFVFESDLVAGAMEVSNTWSRHEAFVGGKK